MEKNTNEKKEKIFVEFSKQQVFNERTIKSNDGKPVTLVSIALSAEHKGYYIDVQKRYVYSSKFNEKMSFISLLKGQNVPIRYYNKETKEQDEIIIKADDVKKEFNSWRNNKKDSPEQNNSDVVKAEEQEEYLNFASNVFVT